MTEHSGFLRFFLVLVLLSNAFSAVMYVFRGGSVLHDAFPAFPSWGAPLLALLALSNIVFAVAVWRGRRWGVYGFAAFGALSALLGYLWFGNTTSTLLNLAGPAVLFALVYPTWDEME